MLIGEQYLLDEFKCFILKNQMYDLRIVLSNY